MKPTKKKRRGKKKKKTPAKTMTIGRKMGDINIDDIFDVLEHWGPRFGGTYSAFYAVFRSSELYKDSCRDRNVTPVPPGENNVK